MQRHKINKTNFSPPTFDDISQTDNVHTGTSTDAYFYSSSNRSRPYKTIIREIPMRLHKKLHFISMYRAAGHFKS